jgi:hypothetical protein
LWTELNSSAMANSPWRELVSPLAAIKSNFNPLLSPFSPVPVSP